MSAEKEAQAIRDEEIDLRLERAGLHESVEARRQWIAATRRLQNALKAASEED